MKRSLMMTDAWQRVSPLAVIYFFFNRSLNIAKELVLNSGVMQVPTVGNQYVNYNYPMTFDSPYLKSEYKSGKIEIQYGNEKLNLDF